MAAGKCFVCRETGHLLQNCPKAMLAKSDRRNKPPGMHICIIELYYVCAEDLCIMAESSFYLQLNVAYVADGNSSRTDSIATGVSITKESLGNTILVDKPEGNIMGT